MAASGPAPAFHEAVAGHEYDAHGDLTPETAQAIAAQQPPPPDFSIWHPLLPRPFDARRVAGALHDAFEGGSDMDVVQVLVTCSPAQRAEAVAIYEAEHGSIEKRLKRKLSGKLETLMLYVVQDPVVLNASLFNDAMAGMGTNDALLIAMCATTPRTIFVPLNERYASLYKKSLQEWIRSESKGDFAEFLELLSTGARPPPGAPDEERARNDAQTLLEAGELAATPSKRSFIEIFARSSSVHLAMVAAEYAKLSRYPRPSGDKEPDVYYMLEHAISRCFGNDKFAQTLMAVLHPDVAIAVQLRESLAGAGTNDERLCKLLVRTSGSMLLAVKLAYQKLYRKPLIRDIEGDCSGEYCVALRRVAASHQGALNAALLRECFKGLGTSDREAVDVLTLNCRDTHSRLSAADAYLVDYGKLLADAIRSEIGGGLAEFLCGIAAKRATFDALLCRRAMRGFGTESHVLVDVICTRDDDALDALKAEYKTLFGKELATAIAGDVGGALNELMQALLANRRAQTLTENEVNLAVAKLYAAGEGKVGTVDSSFVDVLTRYHYNQLCVIDAAYRTAHTTPLYTVIGREFSGDLAHALQGCFNPYALVANRIRASMKGLGTDDRILAWLLAGRTPFELHMINRYFEEETRQSLIAWIKSDTSGLFRDALVRFVEQGLEQHAALHAPV